MRFSVPHDHGLRPVGDDDHSFLIDLRNDPEVLRHVTHPHPITMDQHLRWWHALSQDQRQLRLIFTVGGASVGLTKFYDIDLHNGNCGVGADIHRDWRGRGLATSMWTLMLQRCFDGMELHRVSLTTAEYNHVALRVYHKLGFREEGRAVQSLRRDGRFWDQVLMYMLRDGWAT